jgi:hypothetical protein
MSDLELVITELKKTISALKKENKELKIAKDMIFNRYEQVVGRKLEISQELTKLKFPAGKIPPHLNDKAK